MNGTNLRRHFGQSNHSVHFSRHLVRVGRVLRRHPAPESLQSSLQTAAAMTVTPANIHLDFIAARVGLDPANQRRDSFSIVNVLPRIEDLRAVDDEGR